MIGLVYDPRRRVHRGCRDFWVLMVGWSSDRPVVFIVAMVVVVVILVVVVVVVLGLQRAGVLRVMSFVLRDYAAGRPSPLVPSV